MSPSRVWSYSRKDLMNLADSIPGIKKNIETIHNQVLARALDQVFALGQKKAHERICFLFKMLLERQPGAEAHNLNLPMSRQDIADFLGLTIETVSRAFAKLKEMEIIEVDHIHHVNIIDVAQMEELACAE
jgi:CRP/FNR family transcriptional regulator